MTSPITLTTIEQSELAQCEEVISRGINGFLEVGLALIKVRDQRLYRKDHSTFKEYCENRWSLGQSTAYQMMDAAEVVENLKTSAIAELPKNEAQVRPLTRIPKEKQAEVWNRAVKSADGGKVTAKDVSTAAKSSEVNPITAQQDQIRSTFKGLEIPPAGEDRAQLAIKDFNILFEEHTNGMTYKELQAVETHLDILRRKAKALAQQARAKELEAA